MVVCSQHFKWLLHFPFSLQAWDLWQEGKGLELVDLTIRDLCVEYQVLRCIHVSLLCMEDGVVDRPTMSNMLSMLTNESTQLPLPKKLTFSIGKKAIEANTLNNELELHTVNGLSFSDMDARWGNDFLLWSCMTHHNFPHQWNCLEVTTLNKSSDTTCGTTLLAKLLYSSFDFWNTVFWLLPMQFFTFAIGGPWSSFNSIQI